jgi:hypothetical protein
MIKDRTLWNQWETEYTRLQKPDFARGMRIVEALYQEAQSLGAFKRTKFIALPAHTLKLARALNVSTPARTDRG